MDSSIGTKIEDLRLPNVASQKFCDARENEFGAYGIYELPISSTLKARLGVISSLESVQATADTLHRESLTKEVTSPDEMGNAAPTKEELSES
ncbi:uncharacterized protein H6S33_007966 [Morchella sextelata]|uniref:uncharacterized protein n=1 Tax=Morchella sextelata TaxID=1174677 RepID=UPI001D05A625|nr:uncharacterized protein H6S33_007966 [Morchella sextelata]KAH0602962.1 hypothetical protein H6S33_007966 [Morchella sextelata]